MFLTDPRQADCSKNIYIYIYANQGFSSLKNSLKKSFKTGGFSTFFKLQKSSHKC